jgi:hypothetical protein
MARSQSRLLAKGVLASDTFHLEGSLFTADFLNTVAKGGGNDAEKTKQTAKDYGLPRGWRFIDEFGKSFQIAKEIWKDLQKDPDSAELLEEFLKNVLGYTALKAVEPQTAGEKQYPITHFAAPNVPLVIAGKAGSLSESLPQFAVTGEGAAVGRHKKSPFHLAQEYINAKKEQDSWALVINKDRIRLLRKSPSLARPEYLEVDFGTILTEERYSDFQMFWRIFHASRSGTVWEAWRRLAEEEGARVREGLRRGVTTSLLELGSGFLQYSGVGNSKILDALYSGALKREEYFQELLRLIYRFLFLITIEERALVFAHYNEDELTPEQRKAHELYNKGYSLRRLKTRSGQRSGFDAHGDQWEGIKTVFRCFRKGEPILDLPALGGLFNADQCPHLDAAGLSNRSFFRAFVSLRWTVDNGVKTLVDYRNMGPEELGSVYESLLELVPVIDLPSKTFTFIGLGIEEAPRRGRGGKGNTRKTTGSYYTNDSLVQILIKNNLDPLIAEGLNGLHTKDEKIKALLGITVIDPSCGSGHFLLAAARRLAESLAALKSEDGMVSDIDYQRSLRDIISRCIYGVDLNPLAVELARMALWLEGYEPGKPLSFIDHHIRCGNSLIGVMDFDVLSRGIPEDAYKALSGDDAVFAGRMRNQNKQELQDIETSQGNLFNDNPVVKAQAALTVYRWKLETIQNEDLESVERKRDAYYKLLETPEHRLLKQACDLYVAAFYADKTGNAPTVPTTADVIRALNGQPENTHSPGVNANAIAGADNNRFFHWPLEFPEVFDGKGKKGGGFDCVLGNPPWERIKLQEKEYFAVRYPEIAAAKNKAARDNLIRGLQGGDDAEKDLYNDFIAALHSAEAASRYVHVKKEDNGRYPLTGVGDVNMYALFAETILKMANKQSRCGFIVPSGIATDDTTKFYFANITSERRLSSYFDFENNQGIFPDVHRSFKFCLLSLAHDIKSADLACFLTNVNHLEDPRRHFSLTPEEFALINPNTRTCPVFRSQKDAEITKKVYRNVPVLVKEGNEEVSVEGNPWGVSFLRMFDMSNDSGLFRTEPGEGLLPLYEAKMIHQFDHRWGTFDNPAAKVKPQRRRSEDDEDEDDDSCRDVTLVEKVRSDYRVKPRYWVEKRYVTAKLSDAPAKLVKAWLEENEHELRKQLSLAGYDAGLTKIHRANIRDKAALFAEVTKLLESRCPRWLMGWRGITNVTNERTVITSIFPLYAAGNSLTIPQFDKKKNGIQQSLLYANLDSIVLDYIARQKVGGTNLNFFYNYAIPHPSP